MHDAAGLLLGGRAFVLGGGTASSVPTVQALVPGDASRGDRGVEPGPFGFQWRIGGTGRLRGRGLRRYPLEPAGARNRDGQHFRVAARLAVPVRYAASAVADGRIWVFGGQTAAGRTDVIQRIDPATGAVALAGHLPQPVQGATAIGKARRGPVT